MMNRKLVLWLMVTLLCVRVSSSCCRKKPKESIILKAPPIKDSNKLPLVSPFQKNRWFQCWVLKSTIINHHQFPVEIVKLILTFLKFAPVTTSLSFHEGSLYTGVVSRDGRWLLSMEFGTSVHLSDTSTGQRVKTFKSPGKVSWSYIKLYSCAIADSLQFIIFSTGYTQNNIYLWNTTSEKLVTTLTGHTGSINFCSFFLNDTRIVSSGSVDKTVKVWQIEPPIYNCLYVLRGHTSWILSCVVSADNAWIVSMSDDATLRVWNTDTAECHHILTGHTNHPLGLVGKSRFANKSCVISLDNRYIGSVVYRGETKIWDLTTGECTKTIPRISVEDDENNHFIFYLSSERLVWANYFRVGVWDLNMNKNIYILRFARRVKIVSVSADDKYLTIVLDEPKPLIRVYSFETGEFIEDENKEEYSNFF